MKVKQLNIKKRSLSLLTGLIILVTPTLSKADVTTLGENEIKYTSSTKVANPVKSYYPVKKLPSKNKEDYVEERINARQIWDMVEVDGKIYIATGDYNNENKIKEVPILYYDEKTHKYEGCGYYQEQQISRFNIIDDMIYVPGIDASESWEYGNYYTIDSNGVKKYRNIPNAVHVFDIEKYNGMLFAACGIEKEYLDHSPIKVSYDNGETWEELLFDIDRSKSNVLRFYDLVIINNTLYSIRRTSSIKYEIYKYNNDTKNFELFDKENNIPPPVGVSSRLSYVEKLYYNDYTLICSYNRLYYGTDYNNFKICNFEDNVLVNDIEVRNNIVYILTNKKLDNGKYEVSVYSTTDFINFKQEVLFKNDSLARSFAYATNNNEYLFGIGSDSSNDKNSDNGNIVRISTK